MKKILSIFVKLAVLLCFIFSFAACVQPSQGSGSSENNDKPGEDKPGEDKPNENNPVETGVIKGSKDSASTDAEIIYKTEDGTVFTFSQYMDDVRYARMAREADASEGESGDTTTGEVTGGESTDGETTDGETTDGDAETPGNEEGTDVPEESPVEDDSKGGTWICTYKNSEKKYTGYYSGDASKSNINLKLTVETINDEPVAEKVSFDFVIAEDFSFTVEKIPEVKPKAKFTVTFDTDGGTDVPVLSVYEGDKAVRPDMEITKDTLSFVDWFEDKECTVLFDFGKEITGNITIYAKFSNVPTYKITYVSTVPYLKIEKEIAQGGLVHGLPETIYWVKDSNGKKYKLNGFYKDKDYTENLNYSLVKSDFENPFYPEGDTTIYLKYLEVQKVTVTFEHENAPEGVADVPSVTVYEREVPEFTIPEVEGYYYELKCGSEIYKPGTEIRYNATIKIIWKEMFKVEIGKCDADIYVNDVLLEKDYFYCKDNSYVGLYETDEYKNKGLTFIKLTAEKENFRHRGWSIVENDKYGSKDWFTCRDVQNLKFFNKTIYPVFISGNPDSYTVTFDGVPEGLETPEPITVKAGNVAPPLPFVEGDGKQFFAYWTVGYAYSAYNQAVIDWDKTFRAKFSSTECKLTLVNKKADMKETLSVGKGFQIYSDLLTPFEKEVDDLVFCYWLLEDGTAVSKAKYQVEKDVTLYASYSKIVTFNYEAEHGEAPAPVQINTGYKITNKLPTLPDYIDDNYDTYVFEGWHIKNADGSLGVRVDPDWSNNKMMENFTEKEITLVANWVRKYIHVTFVNEYLNTEPSPGAGLTSKKEVSFKEGYVLTYDNLPEIEDEIHTSDGKIFDDWYVRGPEVPAAGYELTSKDVIIYAKFGDPIKGSVKAEIEGSNFETSEFKFYGDKINVNVKFTPKDGSEAPLESGRVSFYRKLRNGTYDVFYSARVENGVVVLDTGKIPNTGKTDPIYIGYKGVEQQINMAGLFTFDRERSTGIEDKLFTTWFTEPLYSGEGTGEVKVRVLDNTVYHLDSETNEPTLVYMVVGKDYNKDVEYNSIYGKTIYLRLKRNGKTVEGKEFTVSADSKNVDSYDLYLVTKNLVNGTYSEVLLNEGGYIHAICEQGYWYSSIGSYIDDVFIITNNKKPSKNSEYKMKILDDLPNEYALVYDLRTESDQSDHARNEYYD